LALRKTKGLGRRGIPDLMILHHQASLELTPF
jgi:hypothetical protein